MAKRFVHIEDFPVRITLPVLWGHMDAFQHVNNVIYFRYFETARIEYFNRTPLMKIMKEKGVGPILASTSCRYIRPLRYPDTIEVGCRTLWISDSEAEQEYGIYSTKQGAIVAVGTGLIVAYDYEKQQRTTFPEEFFEAVKVIEGDVEIRRL